MYKIIGLLAAATLSAGAQAALLGSTPALVSGHGNSASQSDRATDWTTGQVVLSLQQFNPLLGMLNAVTFHFSGQFLTSYSITSAASSGQTVTLDPVLGDMRFLLPGGITETLDLLGDAVERPLDAGATITGQITAGISGQPRTFTSGLGLFIGTGSFDIGVLADAAWRVSSTDDLDDSQIDTLGNAAVQVTYDYTATRVPEPSALALVGLALAAAALTRRRRV